jgi:acetylornithine/succinyldiaminopimelate/putrescine aminotransferase
MEKIGANYPGLVESVRGLGLMLGMEMTSEDIAIKVFTDCLEEHILVNRTAGKVIRLVPPLIVAEDELSRVFSAIDHSLSQI